MCHNRAILPAYQLDGNQLPHCQVAHTETSTLHQTEFWGNETITVLLNNIDQMYQSHWLCIEE